MKKLLLLMLFVCIGVTGWTSDRVATVNLSLIISMHPRMALFDFIKLGFIKLPLGLPKDEWNERLNELKKIDPQRKKNLIKEKLTLKKTLKEIEQQKRKILNSPELNGLKGSALLAELNVIAKQDSNLRKQLKEKDYQLTCPELTSLEETRKQLNEIEKETMQVIRNVASKSKYTIVLNNSIPAPYGFPVKYETSEMYGVGLPGMDRDLLYAFIANVDHVLSSDENPESMKLNYWLELTSFPKCQNFLPIRPYPLVLCGGNSIDAEVVSAIYSKYKINNKSIIAACSVINTINKRKADYQIEAPKFSKGIK